MHFATASLESLLLVVFTKLSTYEQKIKDVMHNSEDNMSSLTAALSMKDIVETSFLKQSDAQIILSRLWSGFVWKVSWDNFCYDLVQYTGGLQL